MMSARRVLVFLILALGCFELPGFANAELVREEVDALQEIATMMGSTYWNFNAVSCKIEMVGLTTVPPKGSENDVICECLNGSETDCHVVRIKLKGYNLPGVLPPQLVKLPYLREIDLVYNYLNGSIPREWATMQLTFISLLVNRLSGEIPKELGNITSLRYLCLEANQFSGNIPMELGDLVNLETMILSSNRFTGNLPTSLARLINLTDFRINDNSLNETIPGFIQNWRKLERLEMHASGLEGPIPPIISQLSKLLQIKISDIGGPSQEIPQLNNATSLQRVVLRSCNHIGELPAYLWTLDYLEMLDVSFNNLVGKIPSTIPPERLKFIFLTGNSLSGDIPDSILTTGSSVDLAYNNFTLQDPKQPACRENMNMNLNLYQSSSILNSSRPTLPCMKTLNCPRYSNCLHINSGGKDISVKENTTTYLYKGDGDVKGGTATYFLNTENFWGFSSTGDFMDDNNYQNARYTASLDSSNLPELYFTARVSPISLSYFHYCLENGKYTVTLHFAEIQFTNDKSYSSLGKRFFNIYVQERLVWKNFNIQDEVQNAQTPFLLPVRDVNVTNNKLEIRLYYAGRGTTRIPARGVYGPIISALSVVSVDSKACSTEKQKKAVYVVVGIVGASCVILMLLGILWWKGYFPIRRVKRKENDPDLPTGTFSLSQIEAATDEFDPTNKIGEGGFGPVFKGILSDGTVIAVKQLSSKSKQGNREFLNEIGMISCLKHPNVVKLHGFCVEGDQLLLVYEYMENNSLAGALFGDSRKLDWPTRNRICMGIARGLAFLHEESRLKIVHRDIKATNVLLDKNLNPKISDFGLARLDEEEKTHISTRIAGTIGYMAPEYALWGYLTYKVDVYSFGVVVLEIISGKNNSYMPSNNCICLLDWACYLQQTGSLLDIVDDTVRTEMNKEEAEKVIKVALLCTNASPTLRPTMSEVVSMLEGRTAVPESIPAARTYTEDLRFKAMRDLKREAHDQS